MPDGTEKPVAFASRTLAPAVYRDKCNECRANVTSLHICNHPLLVSHAVVSPSFDSVELTEWLWPKYGGTNLLVYSYECS